jgi:hypothetical protein
MGTSPAAVATAPATVAQTTLDLVQKRYHDPEPHADRAARARDYRPQRRAPGHHRWCRQLGKGRHRGPLLDGHRRRKARQIRSRKLRSAGCSQNVKLRAVLTTLAAARAKALEVQPPRTAFVAILQRKGLFRRRPKIEVELLTAPLVKADQPPPKDQGEQPA